MRSFPLVGALLLLAFAGCLGGSGGDAPHVDAPTPTAADASLDNVTVDDGAAPMDMDAGHMPHIHDYWKDRERVTLMDEDVTVDAPEALFWTFVDISRGTPGVGGALVRLPDGQIVYEGSGKLEFTASWTDATVTGMAMSYRTPAETAWQKAGDVKSGNALAIDLTPEMTDMPHAKNSRWQFLLMPAAGQTVVGKFHVKVDIIRLSDITVFPGHPQLFNGEHTLQLFKGSGSSTQQLFVQDWANMLQGKMTDDGVTSQKVVPMETRSMTANLTIKGVNGANPDQVGNVYLLVKPADRGRYMMAEAVESDEGNMVYRFAWLVEMQSTDSPYAEESDWKFDVIVTTDNGALPGECGGCGNLQVEYDLEVIAYDDVVEGSKELRNMDRRG